VTGLAPANLFSYAREICGTTLSASCNADVSRDVAAHVLQLAEKQSASFPRVLGHNHLGGSLMLRGEIAKGRSHLEQALAHYDRAAHHPLATRFGEDQGVATLSMLPWVLWLLGNPEAALRTTDDLKNARETGQAASLTFALHFTSVPLILGGHYSHATALAQELCTLADEKDLPFWRVIGSLYQGSLFALKGDATNAVQMITSGIKAVRQTGATAWMPRWLGATMDKDHDRRTIARRRLIHIENLVQIRPIGLVACDDDAILGRRLEQRLKRRDCRRDGGAKVLLEHWPDLGERFLQIGRQLFHLRVPRSNDKKASQHKRGSEGR